MLLSGGIDSATALYLTRGRLPVRALTFEYHGIARREMGAAKSLARSAKVVEHRVVRLPDLREAGEIAGFRLRGLPPTYIPVRNGIFYSFAASYAEEVGASVIVGGHNKDDSRVFDDVSPSFFDSLGEAFRSGSTFLREKGLGIVRPLSEKRKDEVIRLAAALHVPLGLTWSCHRDGAAHCWACEGCLARRSSFQKAGVRDPLDERRPTKVT